MLCTVAARSDFRERRSSQRLQNLLDASHKPRADRLVIRNNDRYDFISVEKVDWVESANNYVLLHCGCKTHLLSETLSGLEKNWIPRLSTARQFLDAVQRLIRR